MEQRLWILNKEMRYEYYFINEIILCICYPTYPGGRAV
jgi:hypothetical protein